MTYISLQTRASLITLYNEPHRVYHNLTHVYDCLAELEEYDAAEPMNQRGYALVEAAIWFHDAVYNPKSELNVENSVLLLPKLAAFSTMDNINGPYYDLALRRSEIGELILMTKNHWPMNELGKTLCDIDLSILGKPWWTYNKYTIQIR
jgi:predicted metal-dependent HD superfamily phosphohydrolase